MSVSRRAETGAPPPKEASSLHTAIHLVLAELDRREGLSDQTTTRLTRTIGRFGRYLHRGLGVASLAEVRPEDAGSFLEAALSDERASAPLDEEVKVLLDVLGERLTHEELQEVIDEVDRRTGPAAAEGESDTADQDREGA